MLHLVNDFPYETTLCGKSLESVGDEWTDAIYEIVESGPASVCSQCFKAGKAIIARTVRADEEWRHEVAVEEGMLNGVESYNDWSGN